MAFLFGDTFDNYAVANITRKWDSDNAYPTQSDTATISFTSAAGRNGTNGFRISNNTSNRNVRLISVTVPASGSTAIFGAGFKAVAMTSNNQSTSEAFCAFLRLRHNGTTQVWFRLNQNGTISAFNGTTELGATTVPLHDGITYHIGFKTVIGSTGSIIFYIDGIGETILASGDTQNTTNAVWNQIEIGAGSLFTSSPQPTWSWDDVYILDGTGTVNNDFLGDLRGDSLLVTADGANTDWTPNSGANHYDRVNESTPDDDTTYNNTAGIGNIDTYATPNAPVSGADIYAVQLNVLSKKSDAGSSGLKGVMRVGTTNYLSSEKATPSDYTYTTLIFEEDPSSSGLIPEATFNSAEFGYQKSS